MASITEKKRSYDSINEFESSGPIEDTNLQKVEIQQDDDFLKKHKRGVLVHRTNHGEVYKCNQGIFKMQDVSNDACREVQAGRDLSDVPHIPVMIDHSKIGTKLFMVVEDMGKDLLDAPLKTYFEFERFAKIGLQALQSMHKKGIGHFDLKLDNCTRQGLIDLGHARAFHNNSGTQPIVQCSPPEMILGCPKDRATDMWSFGTVLFGALSKQHFVCDPGSQNSIGTIFGSLFKRSHDNEDLEVLVQSVFKDKLTEEITPKCLLEGWASKLKLDPFVETVKKSALLQNTGFDTKCQKEREENLIDLLSGMLKVNPEKRVTAEEALKHPFFHHPNHVDLSFQFKISGAAKRILSVRDAETNELLGKFSLPSRRANICCHVPNTKLVMEMMSKNEDRFIAFETGEVQEGQEVQIDLDNGTIK